ncbi:CHAD domain-containing protein [Labilibaculum sp. DW002]|uniref:CHAD domain-containing protein n=1 Tax=Paralabilibaculum antarcticum TaxID=2912572 RepID=A0ABT5VW39_9BACT|nr:MULTISPECIES: CHAD domain-containing protein [unclassified Labilibaculum]MBI9060093.1 CHAD domain-containing protein [Labilibaculum sp.]MDE5419617.1 CHAD domain-containing protein [Labilibaculum sp. DW002]
MKKGNTNLSGYYREKFDSFLIYLSVLKDLKQDDVHRFRVSVKNIKSLLLLVEEMDSNTEEGLQMQKQLNKLFKYAGSLRTVQISTDLLKESSFEIDPEIFQYLETQKENAIQKLVKQIHQFNIPKFKKRAMQICIAIDQMDFSTIKDLTDRIIHDELEIVRKLFNSSHGEDYHHEIRKLLKIVKGLHHLILSNGEDEDRQIAVEIVNQTESSLGHWHDYKVLDDYLTCMESEFSRTDIKRLIKSIKNRNTKIKLELKNKSDKLLRENFRSINN